MKRRNYSRGARRRSRRPWEKHFCSPTSATQFESTSASPFQSQPTLESIQTAVDKINRDFPSSKPMGVCVHFTSLFTLSYPDSLGSSNMLLLQFNDRQARDAYVDALKKGKA
jgi:hypothetical protein